MKVIAVNASPRKHWNTAMLLESALAGAASAGAETELIHLYDIDYKGCRSCFECKRIEGKSYGRCAVRDGLSPVLESFENADAAIFGSPVYFWHTSGALRSFLERLWFPYLMYTKGEERSLFPRKMRTLFIYASNMSDDLLHASGVANSLSALEFTCKSVFGGDSNSYFCTETLQFDDYSKYLSDMFDAGERARRREEVFPLDLKEVFELGKNLVEQ